MTGKEKIIFFILTLCWLLSLLIFWHWWLLPIHIDGKFGFILNSLILAWVTIIPGYYFFFVAKMKKTNPNLKPPKNLKVAMVVTKAPSEPWDIAKNTLMKCLIQQYPHDTWLADEDPSQETIDWCEEQNIFISSRNNVVNYHQQDWPRRTKCKEGNLSYFYDYCGYNNYDVVVQLDADHVPEINYLEAMITPFIDPKVGYVSAPSICDGNKNLSWAARARLYAESTMHGSLQFGYNDGWFPLCIGSHYAVRTKALKEIGGLGPELAEDHSTTLMMNAHGWRGVHSYSAMAHGDGPMSFTDCMIQEFQWSRSLVVILLKYTPKFFSLLNMKGKFQFLFSQLWYPMFGIVMLLSILIPVVALLTNSPWVNVSYISFIGYSSLITAFSLLLIYWIRSKNWLRPHNAKIISWEVALFQLGRWPWILLGTITALIGVIFKRNFTFKVTPKGNPKERRLPIRMLLPYVLVVIVSAGTAIFINSFNAKGYYFIAILNAIIYSILIIFIVLLHIKENNAK